jgi:hypothetical protein
MDNIASKIFKTYVGPAVAPDSFVTNNKPILTPFLNIRPSTGNNINFIPLIFLNIQNIPLNLTKDLINFKSFFNLILQDYPQIINPINNYTEFTGVFHNKTPLKKLKSPLFWNMPENMPES